MISLAATVLSIVSYNDSDSRTQEENLPNLLAQINLYKMDIESKLMQLNSTLLLLEQNEIQSKLDAIVLISQVMHNISQLFEQHDTTNNNKTSLATTIELLAVVKILANMTLYSIFSAVKLML